MIQRRSLSLLLAASLASPASAQAPSAPEPTAKKKETYRVAGGARDGVSSFDRISQAELTPEKPGVYDPRHFHTYEESTALLKAWAASHPDLVDLYSVGKSLEGRDIWQMTITNKKTGKDTDKPALFIEGGRHSGEISGIEATLYFANELLSKYATDPAMKALVDTKALYVRPHNNPDGNSLYHYTAQTLRSTVRPNDNDNDGLLDEDSGEDLDGDGALRQMRRFVGAGKGNAIKDPKDAKGRAMRRVKDKQGDWEVFPEGIDSDGDGKYNEDGIGGLDLHRNYPENWRPMKEATGRGQTQGGAGEYPLSEPETRAVFMFLMTHPNVAIAQSLDTAIPMLLRGPSVQTSEEGIFPADLTLIREFDRMGLTFTNYPWAGDVYKVYATRTPPDPLSGEESKETPLFGHGPDFGYSYYGAIWYGNEIWNGGRFVDYDADKRFDDWEVLKWWDENRAGKAAQPGEFKEWTAFKHPQLGDVEIGGFHPKFYSQNPPKDLIELWAGNEARFNLWMAQQLPQVKIVSAKTTAVPGQAGVQKVEMVVTNEGKIPTALEIAKRVKMVKPDTAGIELAKGQELVKPNPTTEAQAKVELGWLKPGETKTASWLVKGGGEVTLNIGSTRGGVDSRKLVVP
jgi:hypothetical protein